jgi:RNA polymerase-associated protein RTF1
MEESDSEAEDNVPTKDSDVPYPLEGKYIDAKDQQYINSLPQLERERILGERAEEQSRAKFTAELARRAKGLDQSGTLSDRKRKASSIEPDDSQRKSSRQKVKGKTNDKLEAYKREREQRDQQRQRHDDRRNGRRGSSSDDRGRSSDVDAEGESEVEYPEYVKAPRQEEAAELRHFESVRLSRGYASKYCFHPGFEQAMTGAYVRVGTGKDSRGQTLYSMCQVKGTLFHPSLQPVANL